MMRKPLLALLALLVLAGGASAQTITPQGRLTLTSGKPVMTADVTAATTIYYACMYGNVVPVGAGGPTNLTIGSCQISMGLAAANHLSGSVYDIFGVSNAGTLVICTGPAWTSATARGTGAGTTELTQTNAGLWTNANSMTNCYGGAAGVTDYGTVNANAGTYLGSFYATANGQTAMQFAPAAAAGGTNNFLALYNAYNRVPMRSMSQDSTASWTLTVASGWTTAKASTANRITWLDGLQQSQVSASYVVFAGPNASTNTQPRCGVLFNATSGTPSGLIGGDATNNTNIGAPCAAGNSAVLLGLNYAQAMEQAITATAAFFGNGTQALTLFMAN
jgi:hypothetical protein